MVITGIVDATGAKLLWKWAEVHSCHVEFFNHFSEGADYVLRATQHYDFKLYCEDRHTYLLGKLTWAGI